MLCLSERICKVIFPIMRTIVLGFILSAFLSPGVSWGQDPMTDALSGAEPAMEAAEVFEEEEEELSFEEGYYTAEGLLAEGEELLPLTDRTIILRRGSGLEGFRLFGEAGYGYDSNVFLTPEEKGEWVSFFDLGLSYASSANNDRRFFWGFNLGGKIFSYNSSTAQAGRDKFAPYVRPYFGLNGRKTAIRFDPYYYRNNGNPVDYERSDREVRRSESRQWGIGMAVVRDLDHGSLQGRVDYDETEFDRDDRLNNGYSVVGDLAWLHNPHWAPRTDLGFGVRGGIYDTRDNPKQTFIEPSGRMAFQLSPKTNLDARLGYTFRQYDGGRSIGDDGMFSFGVGANWRATRKLDFRVEGYRDFRPSYVAVGESYNSTGVGLSAVYELPDRWRLRASANYERADYYSTLAGAGTDRQDDYIRVGGELSRNLDLLEGIDTHVTLFYYFTDNDSNIPFDNYQQYFSGLRIGAAY